MNNNIENFVSIERVRILRQRNRKRSAITSGLFIILVLVSTGVFFVNQDWLYPVVLIVLIAASFGLVADRIWAGFQSGKKGDYIRCPSCEKIIPDSDLSKLLHDGKCTSCGSEILVGIGLSPELKT